MSTFCGCCCGCFLPQRMEAPSSLIKIFNLGDEHYGVYPTSANPYMRGTTITREFVLTCLKDVAQYALYPVIVTPNGMSFSDALTKPTSSSSKSKRPPSVSEIGSRFNAKLLQNEQNEYKLSHVFNPSLESILDVQGTFLSVLHKDVITLCSIASIGLENIETSPSASKHTELTAEQVLFSNIVQTLVEAPFSIHAQCQTRDTAQCQTTDTAQSNVHLPTARFDVMVNSLPTASTAVPASSSVSASTSTSSTCKAISGIVLIVNERSEENAEVSVSNKTNETLDLHALNVSIVLEALIFGELYSKEVARIISGSRSYVRPFLRVKKCDALLTFDSVIKWCESTGGTFSFKVAGCIVFLLFLKAGSLFYPNIDANFLESTLEKTDSCGWKTEYEKLPVKYSKELLQMKPNIASGDKGSSLQSPKKSSVRLSKDEFIDERRKRSRHQ